MGKNPEASLALTNMRKAPSFALRNSRTGRDEEEVEKMGMQNESV